MAQRAAGADGRYRIPVGELKPMLYQVHEAQRAILTPVSGWAESMSRLYASPYSPFSYMPLATRAAAGFELLHRLGKAYEKPAFGLKTTRIDGTDVAITERIVLPLGQAFPVARKESQAVRFALHLLLGGVLGKNRGLRIGQSGDFAGLGRRGSVPKNGVLIDAIAGIQPELRGVSQTGFAHSGHDPGSQANLSHGGFG